MRVLFLFLALVTTLSLTAQPRWITIDSTDIWVNTVGLDQRQPGQPVVVFESGLGTPMGHWDPILAGVAELAPLITYDRPGIGESEPDQALPTLVHVADQLIRILATLEVPPPYMLVGHSLGGAYVRGFAGYYPEFLAGLVIIDPADFTETRENQHDYYDVLGWEEAKVDSLIAALAQKRANRSNSAPLSIQEEGQVLAALRATDFQEIKDHPLPNIPVHIITGGRFDLPKRFWSDEYDEEALFRSKMRHRVARWTDVIQSVDKGMLFYSGDAGHFVHRDDPALVIASIRLVLQDYALLQVDNDR